MLITFPTINNMKDVSHYLKQKQYRENLPLVYACIFRFLQYLIWYIMYPSIIYVNLNLSKSIGARTHRQQSLGRCWGTSWTGHQSITSHTQRQTFMLTLTPRSNLELPVNTPYMILEFGKKPKGTLRKPTYAQGDLVKSNINWSCWELNL